MNVLICPKSYNSVKIITVMSHFVIFVKELTLKKNKTMSKQDLIDAIASETGFTKTDSKKALDELIVSIDLILV